MKKIIAVLLILAFVLIAGLAYAGFDEHLTYYTTAVGFTTPHKALTTVYTVCVGSIETYSGRFLISGATATVNSVLGSVGTIIILNGIADVSNFSIVSSATTTGTINFSCH